MTRRARVLLVDDDPRARLTTTAQLAPDAIDVVELPGGVEALEYLAQPAVDLVICDVMMPEIDGYTVARAYKAHAEWQFVPIILLTALDTPAAIVAGLEAGADDFVSKPIAGPILRARARAMLRVATQYRILRAAAAPPPAVSESRRAAIVARANLTAREREVLELLLLGRTHDDIAIALGISERTSRFHQANLFAKLGAESRLDLLRVLAD